MFVLSQAIVIAQGVFDFSESFAAIRLAWLMARVYGSFRCALAATLGKKQACLLMAKQSGTAWYGSVVYST